MNEEARSSKHAGWLKAAFNATLDTLMPPVEAPEGASPAAGSTSAMAETSAPAPVETTPPLRVASAAPQVDPIMAHLRAGVFNAAKPSAYQRFMELMEELKPDIADEARRASVVLKTSKISAADLIRAVDEHLKELQGDLVNIRETSGQEYANRVTAREEQAAGLGETLQEKGQQLGEIQAEIARLTSDRTRIMDEIASERENIRRTNEQVEAAGAALAKQLTGERERFKRFLKGA